MPTPKFLLAFCPLKNFYCPNSWIFFVIDQENHGLEEKIKFLPTYLPTLKVEGRVTANKQLFGCGLVKNKKKGKEENVLEF